MIPPAPWKTVSVTPWRKDEGRFYILDADGEAAIPAALDKDLAEYLVNLVNRVQEI